MTPFLVSWHPTDSEIAVSLPMVFVRGSCENWNCGLGRVYNAPRLWGFNIEGLFIEHFICRSSHAG